MPEKIGGKLGELLVEAGLIDELQLKSALGHQKKWGGRLGKVLVDMGFIEEGELLKFLSEKFKIKAVDLTKSKIPNQAFEALPEKIARKYGVVPVFIKEGPGTKKTLILAMSDPTNLKIIDEIQFLTGYRIEPVLATDSAITKVLEHYGNYDPSMLEPAFRKDIARPVDLKKEHKKEETKAKEEEELETLSDENIMLEPEDSEEILNLEEINEEGIDIIPDQDLEVVKDEVVMVKAPEPKPRVGSSTERIPSRAPIQDQLGKIPEVESVSSSPPPPQAETQPEEPDLKEALKVPEIKIFGEEEKPKPKEVQEETAEPEPHPEPIEIPEEEGEEKFEVAPAYEFVEWQPKTKEETQEPVSELAEEQTDLSKEPQESEFISFSGTDQEQTQIATPDEDLWKETEPISSMEELKLGEEERLPFEKPPSEEPAPPQSFLGKIEDLTQEPVQEEGEPYVQSPISEQVDEIFEEPEELSTGEMSLEFALEKIEKLEDEIRKKEFQINELINLMMKKELGEITTEIFMRELEHLKSQLKKKK